MKSPKVERTVEPTELDKAYFAGLIDGEGCLTIVKRASNSRSPRYEALLQVAMCDEDILRWCSLRWGGTVYYQKARLPSRREHWVWHITSKLANRALEDAYQHLKVKKPQALWLRSLRALALTGPAMGYRAWVPARGNRRPECLSDVYEKIRLNVIALNSGRRLSGKPGNMKV